MDPCMHACMLAQASTSDLPAGRASALAAAGPPKIFRSHCAPDEDAGSAPEKASGRAAAGAGIPAPTYTHT